MAGLDASGLTILTIDEIIDQIATKIKDEIDPGIDTTPASFLGVLIGIFAERERDLWLLLRDVYAAGTPGGAFGQALRQLALLTGTEQREATYSTVEGTVNLNAATTLPLGSRANVAGDPDSVFETLVSAINAGGSPANVSVAMRAVNPGPVRANSGTLTTITTPVSGWNSVTNALDADMGLNVESEQELRERRELELRAQGSSNLDAIIADVDALEDVLDVVGRENTSASTDADGLPAHSFQIVLWDGPGLEAVDNEIAQAIWESKPAGILSYGTTTGTAVDASGADRDIDFSRADSRAIYLGLDIEIEAEDFPVDGDAQIKEAIVAYADERWRIGSDVVPSALFASIFSVSGVTSVNAVRLGFSASPVGTVNLTIAFDEKALADTSRITIAHV